MMITAENLKAPFFSATRRSSDTVPAYKSFLHHTRFLVLSLVLLHNAVIYGNSILVNFSVICMSDVKLELILNGTHSDYEIAREAVFARTHDFRAHWFTYTYLQRSILFSMSPLASLLMMYPSWLLIMKFGYRRVVSSCSLLSTFLTAFLPWTFYLGFPSVLSAQFLLGACAPSALLLLPSVIRKWSTRKNDHFCFLALFTFQQIAPVFIFPIAAFISKSFLGWPVIFYFQSIFSFIFTTVFFYFYKETPIRHANVSDNELERIQREEAIRGNIDFKKMLRCHQFQSVSLSIFTYFLPICFFVQYLPSYLHDIMDQSLQNSAWTVSGALLAHFLLKTVISRLFESSPSLTNLYSIKFVSLISFAGPAIIMITLFVTKFHFDIQLIFFIAISGCLSLAWPSLFKSSYIISNKYYLPVMIRVHLFLFYLASLFVNVFSLIFGRNDDWESWRYIWLLLSVLLIASLLFFWTTFQFEKSDWDMEIPEEPPKPIRPEDIAPVSHPRPCQFSTSFDDEIVVSIISRGLDRCDTCKKHGIDARVHSTSPDDVIPTRKMFDELLQQEQEPPVTITRF